MLCINLMQTEATATQPTDFPNLSLISGGLIGNGPSGTATGENVPEGFEPEFVTPAATDEPPAQVWCGVVSTDQFHCHASTKLSYDGNCSLRPRRPAVSTSAILSWPSIAILTTSFCARSRLVDLSTWFSNLLSRMHLTMISIPAFLSSWRSLSEVVSGSGKSPIHPVHLRLHLFPLYLGL